MRNFLIGLSLTILSLSANAASLITDSMQVNGTTEDNRYRFSLSAGDAIAGENYYLSVVLLDQQNPPILLCNGTVAWDPVETTGSAKYAESMFNTGDGTGANGLNCLYGANEDVLVQCNFDGQIWRHTIGSAISIEWGETMTYKTSDKYATAECSVELDGLQLNVINFGVGSSHIRREQEVD